MDGETFQCRDGFPNMTCHILASTPLRITQCLRVGFPKSNLIVYGNRLSEEDHQQTAALCRMIKAEFVPIQRTADGDWIESLILHGTEPFWICSTQVTFRGCVENYVSECAFAGRLDPEKKDQALKMITVERLHPNLLWVDPVRLRSEIRTWPSVCRCGHDASKPLIKPMLVPFGMAVYFFDVCAGLHQALKGEPFDESMNRAFDFPHG